MRIGIKGVGFDPVTLEEAAARGSAMMEDGGGQLMEHAPAAAELFPLHLRPYLILAEGYLQQGDCKQAKQSIGRALMVSPSDPNVTELNYKIKQKCQED